MARRYKPLPAGAIVVMQIFGTTAQVISDDGAGLVYVQACMRAYDYQTHKRRSQIRLATQAEADAHRQRVAQIMEARLAAQVQVQVQAVLDELAAAARVTPAPADPAG